MRLVWYRRLSGVASGEALLEVKIEMIDRFGLLPPQAERLFESARLRIEGEALGLSKVRAGARSAILDFGPEPKINPSRLIKLIQGQPRVYKLEGSKRLHITAPLDPPETRAEKMLNLLTTLRAS